MGTDARDDTRMWETRDLDRPADRLLHPVGVGVQLASVDPVEQRDLPAGCSVDARHLKRVRNPRPGHPARNRLLRAPQSDGELLLRHLVPVQPGL